MLIGVLWAINPTLTFRHACFGSLRRRYCTDSPASHLLPSRRLLSQLSILRMAPIWSSALDLDYTQNLEERKHFTEKKELGRHLNARDFTVSFRTSQRGL